MAFARAAVAIDATDTALGITARIGHAERRGMIETEVVRWLLRRSPLLLWVALTNVRLWPQWAALLRSGRAPDLARAQAGP